MPRDPRFPTWPDVMVENYHEVERRIRQRRRRSLWITACVVVAVLLLMIVVREASASHALRPPDPDVSYDGCVRAMAIDLVRDLSIDVLIELLTPLTLSEDVVIALRRWRLVAHDLAQRYVELAMVMDRDDQAALRDASTAFTALSPTLTRYLNGAVHAVAMAQAVCTATGRG